MIKTLNPRAVRLFAVALLAVLLAGVAADCSGPTDGMYQGPNDSAPEWRK